MVDDDDRVFNISQNNDHDMKVFDRLCFKGNHHVKRGQGLKQFTSKRSQSVYFPHDSLNNYLIRNKC